MAQSVSNDALWGKLSEMDKKLDKLSKVQELLVLKQESPEIIPIIKEVKEAITTEIKSDIHILSLSTDSQFKANEKNIVMLNGNILNTLKEVTLIRKQQSESGEPQKPDNSCFNKVRKTFFVIAILGVLVFILTLFCMKQQNDYALLMNEYHKQNVTIQKLNEELKVFEEKYPKKTTKKWHQ